MTREYIQNRIDSCIKQDRVDEMGYWMRMRTKNTSDLIRHFDITNIFQYGGCLADHLTFEQIEKTDVTDLPFGQTVKRN